jgi:hypothetical protein
MYVILLKEQLGENDAIFNNAISSQQIRNMLNHGRFSGDSMNLWSALSQVDIPISEDDVYPGAFNHAKTILKNRVTDIAELFDARLTATINREIAGLELQVKIDLAGVDSPHTDEPINASKFENKIKFKMMDIIERR